MGTICFSFLVLYETYNVKVQIFGLKVYIADGKKGLTSSYSYRSLPTISFHTEKYMVPSYIIYYWSIAIRVNFVRVLLLQNNDTSPEKLAAISTSLTL